VREIIILDLQKSSSAFVPVIYLRARRGDSRSLSRTFQILDDGEPVNLTDCTVSFMAENAGGSPIMEEVESADQSGIFTYRFPDAVAAVRGSVTMAYFRVEGEDYVASTNSLSIEVLDNVDLTNEVTGAYVPMLDRIIEASTEMAANADAITSQATQAINACTEITEDATEAEQARVAAEALRVQAEAQRVSNYNAKMAEWELAVLGLTNGITVNEKGQLCTSVIRQA
jgi:microcystin-dependent protein